MNSMVSILFIFLIVLAAAGIAGILVYNRSYRRHVDERLEEVLNGDNEPKKTMPSATSVALAVLAAVLIFNIISLWGGIHSLESSISVLSSRVDNLMDRAAYLESLEDPPIVSDWTSSVVGDEWENGELMITEEVSILTSEQYLGSTVYLSYGDTTVQMEPDSETWELYPECPAFKAEITFPLFGNGIDEVYVRAAGENADHTEALGWCLCDYALYYLPCADALSYGDVSSTGGKLKFKGGIEVYENYGECDDQLKSVTICLNIAGETVETWDVTGENYCSQTIRDSWDLGGSSIWEFFLVTETEGGWTMRQGIMASDELEGYGTADYRAPVFTDPYGVEHTISY